MKIEQALLSQLMILLNIKNGKNRPSELSKELNITVQGVVYHMKILHARNFIDENNKITKEGFDFLYNGLNYIEDFVHSSLINIDASLVWEVISDEDLRKDDQVYLYMDGGYLHAGRSKRSDSKGIAVMDSVKNSCTGITGIHGIINIVPSKIIILSIDNIERDVDMPALTEKLQKAVNDLHYDFIGIRGELAKTLSDRIGLSIKFEYAAVSSAFEAAKRGYITLIIMSDRLFHFSMNEIKDLQARNEEIELDLKHL
ncbi:MAG: hypothetical protein QXZ44_01515 [Ferroplasma sp.]